MSTELRQDWTKGDKSGMISIGTHKLYLSVSGGPRLHRDPIVILMQGLGSSLAEWGAVKRLVTPYVRWVEYDRSGLGQSESRPDKPELITAVDVAKELDLLLRTAGIHPPFIIVAHSWGGLTSREFLNLRKKGDIVGMIFVDANQEKHHYYRQEPMPETGFYQAPYMLAINDGLDYAKYSGLAVDHKLTEAEWAQIVGDRKIPKHEEATMAELRAWQSDSEALAVKKQFETQPLGRNPVSVLRGDSKMELQRMYDAGVAKGNGTEEERAAYRQLIASWDEQDIPMHKEILKLSNNGRFSTVEGSLHCIHMVNPEAVADEIRVIFDQNW